MAELLPFVPPPPNLVPPCPAGAPAFLAAHWEEGHLGAAPMILGPLEDGEQELWRTWTAQIVRRGEGISVTDARRLATLLAAARLVRATRACVGVAPAGDSARPALEAAHHQALAAFDGLRTALGLHGEAAGA